MSPASGNVQDRPRPLRIDTDRAATGSPLLEILPGCRSLLVGMRVTLTQFFKPVVTVPYPHTILPIPDRYRGHIELILDSNTGRSRCTACKLCERACPSSAILVEGVRLEGEKKKSVTDYRLDFTKCSLCGLCVEACPSDAIRFSKEYNLAGTRREDYQFDLVQRLLAEKERAGL